MQEEPKSLLVVPIAWKKSQKLYLCWEKLAEILEFQEASPLLSFDWVLH
jgi:hypothetical protein